MCVSTSACAQGRTCNLATGTCDATAGGYTIWPTNPVPAIVDGNDPGAVELGVKFTSDVAGTVTGIRFYKSATNTGTHVGNLWSSNGVKLGTVTFTAETTSGWQQVNFSPPLQIQANTVYVASYFAPNGHFSGNLDYFAAQGVDTPPLHTPANGVSGGNGVFAYGAASTFPANSYRSLNYWVDVVFSPQATAQLTSIAVTPANPAVAVGGTQQFTATGTYSDQSTQNLTSQVTWTSSSTAVATINGTGRATGVSQGSTTVTGALGELNGTSTLTVQAPGGVTITTTQLPVGVKNTAYSATLAASGGNPPYTWSIASGTLPAGLTLASSTGVISGTPTATGLSTVTVRATAGALTGTQNLVLSIGQNEIAAENVLPGNPASQWDVSGAGDTDLQGFATDISVNKGETVSFKIQTPSSSYRIDIYRLGYYGGLGARLVATVQPSATLPQTQPACVSDISTGLVDCGNWAVSASWNVPATATSGIYIAKLVRQDPRTAAPATSPSSCVTTAVTPTCCSRPRTPPGRPTTRTAATASTSARRPGAPTR